MAIIRIYAYDPKRVTVSRTRRYTANVLLNLSRLPARMSDVVYALAIGVRWVSKQFMGLGMAMLHVSAEIAGFDPEGPGPEDKAVDAE